MEILSLQCLKVDKVIPYCHVQCTVVLVGGVFKTIQQFASG